MSEPEADDQAPDPRPALPPTGEAMPTPADLSEVAPEPVPREPPARAPEEPAWLPPPAERRSSRGSAVAWVVFSLVILLLIPTSFAVAAPVWVRVSAAAAGIIVTWFMIGRGRAREAASACLIAAVVVVLSVVALLVYIDRTCGSRSSFKGGTHADR